MRWLMRTRPIRFTRFGTFYILFAIGVGAAAINTGNNLLYLILGILLGFIVISGFLSDSGLWGIRTEWQPLSSLYAAEKSIWQCKAMKGWFPGVAVTIDAHWAGLPKTSAFIPWIPARGSFLAPMTLSPKKRGRLILESCIYATRFPFGLFQKRHTEIIDKSWIVYPAIRRLPDDVLARAGEDTAPDSAEWSGRGSIPFVLREYRTGDALRQVHWKATAKRQRLIIKEMEDDANEGDLFVLRAWPTPLDGEKLERLISFLASLVFKTYDQGRPVGLVVPEQVFAPEYSRSHLHRILEFLALVQPGRTPRGSEQRPVAWNGRVTDVLRLWIQQGDRYGP